MIPTSDHNEALAGDTLYSAFLNHEWREIVVIAVLREMERLAATIADEIEKQAFEVRYGALIEDFYNEDIVDSVPVGMVSWFPVGSAGIPAKWLACTGQALSNVDYPDLYAVIHPSFRTGGGGFTLPDLRSRFLYGASSDDDIGDSGGEEQHTLSIAEIPAHSHVIQSKGGATGAILTNGGYLSNAATPYATTTTPTASTGDGESHNNMPPYMKGYWCIKALP